MMRSETDKAPSWALAILFWRKVQAVESRGIPGRSVHVVEGSQG